MGHEVILYGIEENDTPCTDFVSCMAVAEQQAFIGDVPYQNVPFDANTPLFLTFNTRAAQAIRDRKAPRDLIATIAGSAQMFVSEHHPELRMLEYSIGYRGIAGPYRVFQSQAWRHVVHGFTGVDGGRDFDAVIPPWFETLTLPPFERAPESYVLYCGRFTASKGLPIACEAAKRAGVKLLIVGHGDAQLITYGECLGAVSTPERNRLMAKARAVLMPTRYIEPFGNVSAEAQLCGTPVISTDHGAFTETVEQCVSGYRCTTLGEFVQAIDLAKDLDRLAIRLRARSLWDLDAARTAYAAYFRRLDLVGNDGWRDLAPGFPVRADYEFAS